MNIVYLLTNVSKTSGKRFYVGSKVECKLLDIEGIPTIFNVKTGKPYYSSSTCSEMRADLERGDVLSASVLEVVTDRESLRDRENFHIATLNAVASEEFYNKSGAFKNTHDGKAIANKYGETVGDYASRSSQASKRDGTARALGFSNFGTMYFEIHRRMTAGESNQVISEGYGKHRKWAQVLLRDYDMAKASIELEDDKTEAVRDLVASGASLKRAAEILSIEIPTARVFLGDFDQEGQKTYSVAKSRGLTKEEMEVNVIHRILAGEEIIDICNSTALVRESVLRYFMRGIKRCIKPEMVYA